MIESNRLTEPAHSSSGQLVEALPTAVTTPIADTAWSDAIARPRKRVENWRRLCRCFAGRVLLSVYPSVFYTKSSSVSCRRVFRVPHRPTSRHVSGSANHISTFPEKRKKYPRIVSKQGCPRELSGRRRRASDRRPRFLHWPAKAGPSGASPADGSGPASLD